MPPQRCPGIYALVEAEAILACQTVGLNPGLGIVHAVTPGPPVARPRRHGAVRAEVDSFVFALVEQRTFRKVDFVDTTDGHVRIRSPLTHELAKMMPRWAQAFPRCLREVLRGLVKVPHPAVVAKDFELLNRQRAQLSRTNISVDVAQRAHARDDRRDGGV